MGRIEQLPVGRTPLRIGRIGLGSGTFGREIDEETSRAVLDHAFQHGVTCIDSAEGYGGRGSGAFVPSERILGTWMAECGVQDQVVVMTKVGSGNSPRNIERVIGQSLERLQLDRVAVYMVHHWDDEVPLDETLHALHEVVASGRGAGDRGAAISPARSSSRRWRSAGATAGRGSRSSRTSTTWRGREEERNSMPVCDRHQVTFLAFSSLGAGFLTGKYANDRGKLPDGTRFDVAPGHCDVYFSERNFRVVERLRAKAAELGESMAYLAGAWTVSNPSVGSTLFRRAQHPPTWTTRCAACATASTPGSGPRWRAGRSAPLLRHPPAMTRSFGLDHRQLARFETFGFLQFPGLFAAEAEGDHRGGLAGAGGGRDRQPNTGQRRSIMVPFIDPVRVPSPTGQSRATIACSRSPSTSTPVDRDSGALRVIPGSHRLDGDRFAQQDTGVLRDFIGGPARLVRALRRQRRGGPIVLPQPSMLTAEATGTSSSIKLTSFADDNRDIVPALEASSRIQAPCRSIAPSAGRSRRRPPGHPAQDCGNAV